MSSKYDIKPQQNQCKISRIVERKMNIGVDILVCLCHNEAQLHNFDSEPCFSFQSLFLTPFTMLMRRWRKVFRAKAEPLPCLNLIICRRRPRPVVPGDHIHCLDAALCIRVLEFLEAPFLLSLCRTSREFHAWVRVALADSRILKTKNRYIF